LWKEIDARFLSRERAQEKSQTPVVIRAVWRTGRVPISPKTEGEESKYLPLPPLWCLEGAHEERDSSLISSLMGTCSGM
jgi:hypothetical protein